ncbi:MAG TPA: hypothetical protein VFO77_07330 [Actinoplanes sp.]|nr:hypothetical protein [Actinoplanes sp.]
MTHRPLLTGIAVLCLWFTAGCGTDDPAPAPTPAGASASAADFGSPGNPIPGAPADAGGPSAGPAVPAEPVTPAAEPTVESDAQLSASGLGPYQVGASRKQLAASGLFRAVRTSGGCPDHVVATGLKAYRSPSLVFYRGKLQYTTVTSAKTTTTAGARVGMTAAQVKQKHPNGKQLDDWNAATAWFAPAGSNALLFRFTDGKVSSIDAGLAEPIQFRFTDGEGC